MEPFRLRLKIGDHEFEAQGDQETVERQFAAWREMIASLPSPPPVPVPVGVAVPVGLQAPAAQSAPSPAAEAVNYDKVFRKDKRDVVSLTVLPQGDRALSDGGLLILMGRKHYLDEDLVGGAWLLDGLRDSGMPIGRVDRVFGDYYPNLVTTVGTHRATRYRLTNLGMSKAVELAKGLERMVV